MKINFRWNGYNWEVWEFGTKRGPVAFGPRIWETIRVLLDTRRAVCTISDSDFKPVSSKVYKLE